MDYKKKYEEALCNFNIIKDANKNNKEMVAFIEHEYPELKESDDNIIKEEIISYIKSSGATTNRKWVDWLEKQGEQKSTEKVEPKLEIEKGKWYVCDIPRYTDFVVGKAYYCPKNGMLKPSENEMARYVASYCFHLWTIQDVKDGDVLAKKDIVFIFKHMNKAGLSLCESYCEVIGNSKLGLGFYFSINNVYPATKEQRDLLFQKMKEAGYEWDADKKELKKIKQKLDTDFFDLRTWKYIVDAVLTEKEGIGQYLDSSFTEEVAKKLQKRFGNVQQKTAWSKKNEKILNQIQDHLREYYVNKKGYPYVAEPDSPEMMEFNWLKSLKERMKGE